MTEDRPSDAADPDRRGLLTGGLMTAGLLTSYGAAGLIGARYLFPSGPGKRAWLFVARADEFTDGSSISYRSPSGQRVAVARQGTTGAVEDFVALSSTCPHLGCQVHWEAVNERFFCPCHNGSFDLSGKPLGGPVKEANQSLPQFPLKIEDGLLYIEVPVETLSGSTAMQRDDAPPSPGAGHDPCLGPDCCGGELA